MTTKPVSPEQWREMAERARSQAASITDGESKMIILQIADAYERLAKRVEFNSKRPTRYDT
jgi:hypothetical protein